MADPGVALGQRALEGGESFPELWLSGMEPLGIPGKQEGGFCCLPPEDPDLEE
jgi:hypothetical protein